MKNSKKGQGTLQGVLLSLIIFSLFVTGGVLIMGNINTNYAEFGVNMTTGKFANITDTIDSTYTLSSEMKQDALEEDLEGGDQVWDSTIKGSYSAVRELTTPLNSTGAILNEIAKQIGVPPFMITFALTVIVLTIVFGIIYMIFRFKG